MVSAVRSRPNHYETLGIAPGASGEEVDRAFAREVSLFRPRPFGGVAEVSIAYEVLRDPDKRSAYDASIGLGPKPQPSAAPTAWRVGTPFIGYAPGTKPEPRPVATIEPQPRPDLPVEPRTATFIAESLRAPVERPARARPRAEAQDHVIDWRRPALAAGALVAAAILVGGFAGWQAGNGDEQADAAVTAALPPPKAVAAVASRPSAPAGRIVEAIPRRPTPARVVRATRTPIGLPKEQLAEATAAEVAQPADGTTEQAAPDTPAVESGAAPLPLSKAVIARTIHRIGYACGQVASTSAGEAAGVFTVTCTSGASYQATPVRGRYHFRRLGSR